MLFIVVFYFVLHAIVLCFFLISLKVVLRQNRILFAGGQTGYFQQPGSSAQLPQHQAGYGLQGNIFGTHSQSHTNPSLQGFNSHFLSAPMQIATATALNVQQYRSQNLQNAAYLKSQAIGDQTARPQQLKSPGAGQQEVLSSVFNSSEFRY